MTVPMGLRVVVCRLLVREGHSPVVAGTDRYSELLQPHLRPSGRHRLDYSRHRAIVRKLEHTVSRQRGRQANKLRTPQTTDQVESRSSRLTRVGLAFNLY